MILMILMETDPSLPEVANMGWMFIVSPVLLDACVLIACSILLNNLSPDRSYPQFW